jgi:hypothetical protein
MEKLCLLLAFNLLWIVPSPAAPPAGGPAAREEVAPRVAPPELQQILPAPAVPQDKGGRIPGDVYQWITVEINGTLDYNDGGLRPRIPEFGTWVGYSVTADGKWYGLDFRTNMELEEKAKRLTGKRAVVKGTVEERTLDGFIKQQIKVVVVSDLEAAPDVTEADSVKETVHLEVEGELDRINLIGPPAAEGWSVQADKQTYHLKFDTNIPREKPESLRGKRVLVTGTRLDELTILVSGLRIAGNK